MQDTVSEGLARAICEEVQLSELRLIAVFGRPPRAAAGVRATILKPQLATKGPDSHRRENYISFRVKTLTGKPHSQLADSFSTSRFFCYVNRGPLSIREKGGEDKMVELDPTGMMRGEDGSISDDARVQMRLAEAFLCSSPELGEKR